MNNNKELQTIIEVTQTIKVQCHIIDNIKNEMKNLEPKLIKICRNCYADNCPITDSKHCLVKEAYELLSKVK